MRLGVFGGTFDPVHYGHLLLAEQCREQARLDEIVFIPAGIPPHKVAQTVATGPQRAEMLELATAGHAGFRVDRRELSKPDPAFTVETLAELRREDAARDLFFLMGADSLRDFPTWRQPARILELATLVVVNRAEVAAVDLEALRALAGADVESRLLHVSIPGMDISSSDIRRRVRSGQSIRYMTPRAVECFIDTHNLYRHEDAGEP
jgi:nicotinate-nucleotide adenylyltransferase